MMFSDANTEPRKRCSRCRQWLPLDTFWRCTSASDGLQPRCKPCHAAAKVAIRTTHLETYRARERAEKALAYAAEPERHRAKSRAFVALNPDKARASREHARAAKPDKYRVMAQEGNRRYLLRQYRLSASEFAAMLAQQNGLCAICSLPLVTGSATHIDHDHVTGAVRGLLCGTCNRGIGCLRDSTDLLERAIAYLRSHR